jgi:hypothetical protein
MVGGEAARGADEGRLGERQPRLLRTGDGPRQGRCRAPVVDRAAEAVELIGRRLVDARRDEQPIERQLDVVAAGALVADGQADVLLDRRPRMKARVVPRAEQTRAAQVGQLLAQRPHGRHEVLVVAGAIGLEPVAVVVGLELAQELERLGREAPEAGRYGTTTGAIVTGLWMMQSSSSLCATPVGVRTSIAFGTGEELGRAAEPSGGRAPAANAPALG